MSAPLETAYRRLLRWYPRAWRSRNADAFVGTLLDVADGEGRTAPTRGEAMSMASHGIAARLDRVAAPRIRNAGSTIALTLGSGVAVATFVMGTWAPFATPVAGIAPWPASAAQLGTPSFVLAVLWTAALATRLVDRWPLGRILLAASVAFSAVAVLLPTVFAVDRPTVVLLASCAVVAAAGLPVRGRATGLAALGWGVLAALAFALPPEMLSFSARPGGLWDNVGAIWYAAGFALVVSIGLACARLWGAAFTVVLGILPIAVTFTVARLTGDLHENGSALAIAGPVALGMLLLVLSSSGRLDLGRRRPARPSAEEGRSPLT